jgi:hypothetical protein
MVGDAVGAFEGEVDGARDEEIVGKRDGIPDGSADVVGPTVGDRVGLAEGPARVGGALEVGGALAVGTDEGASDSTLVGTDEGESDWGTPPIGVGPAVGAKVWSTSLARHEISVANCSQSKKHSRLSISKHILPGLSTIALKPGSVQAANA